MAEIMNSMRKEEEEDEDLSKINVPVRLIWGDNDWPKPSKRQRDRSLLPSAEMVTVEIAGTSCRSIDPMP